MEAQGSLPHLQESITELYPVPVESSPHAHTL
jgi:hypothetical protein